MPARPRPALRTLWRGTRTAAIAVLGLALASAAYLAGNAMVAALLIICGFASAVVALGLLYDRRRPLRFKSVPLSLGVLALLVLYGVGVILARDIAMTLVGTDADAVVARTWTTQYKRSTQPHCTLRHADGTSIPHEYASNCEGLEPGDTLPVVLDPQGRFPPVAGPKADLPGAGELQVAATAALILLLSIAIGSPPKRP
ncbi:hypothetical protein [Actinomadura sp. 6K520]|uniref:hypothetical protein n=1 Tax=Actinomadura sp. 6K520 TaxID=2530364 RepID=UPI001044406A|nr:hypothetical protein [Actinomadura sp. 6K520]TDE20429.1 hypothetical protein E1289_32185 [Actinomadura sp. 6K520]